MIIKSSNQIPTPKNTYQAPKLEKNNGWKPLVQAFSKPAGPTTGARIPSIFRSLF